MFFVCRACQWWEDYLKEKVAPLGQTTKYASLEKFVSSAFIYAYKDLSLVRARNVEPLAAYLRQLKRPKINESISVIAPQKGLSLYNSGCRDCHNGAAGESTRLYPASLVGTHQSLESPRDNYSATTPIAKLISDLSVQLAAELKPQPRGIRSRRLVGVWSRKKLMIDGSVEDLNDLFCMQTGRRFSQSPHQDLCQSFNQDEKEAIISYLKTL